MTPYGKTTQHAIAAMSRLAQVYHPTKRVKLNSSDIADSRGLPKPVVAKVLTGLSQAGLVAGSPGPGGGYWLAKPPDQITFLDVAMIFDRLEEALSCPFGPEWCGNNPCCPVHHQLEVLREQFSGFMKRNTFACFVGWDQQKGGPVDTESPPEPPAKSSFSLNLLNIPPVQKPPDSTSEQPTE